MASHALKKRKLEHLATGSREPSITDSGSDSDSDSGSNGAPPERPSSRQIPTRSLRNESRPHATASPFMGEAHHSSLFKFKVDELLAQVRPNYEKRMVKAEKALHKLKQIIERIPNREPLSVSQAEHLQQKTHGIPIPFTEPRPSEDMNYKLAYSKPANISVIGSYAQKTAIQIKENFVIDLAVTMPSRIFQEKDYLNYRYFHKRAYYLACLAAGILGDKTCKFDIMCHQQNDNPLQPIIIVNPSTDGGEEDFRKSKCQIRILLIGDANLFDVSKTLPNKNCLRKFHDANDRSVASNAASSLYNASLRSECSALEYLKVLHSASLNATAFHDACLLGSIWLRQRSLGTGLASGGFGPFEWACTMSLLLQGGGLQGKPVLSSGYSNYQMFKAILQYLSVTNLIQKPAYIKSDPIDVSICDGPILFDGIRGLNILFKMTPWSYAALRNEASNTLKLLNDPIVDQFDACFITRLDGPLETYDRLVRLPFRDIQTSTLPSKGSTVDSMMLSRQAYHVFTVGLGDRISHTDIVQPRREPWSFNTMPPQLDTEELLIGLLLNHEHINRSVDKGPSAEEKDAAAEFRNFWGEKAELRRFKDGSIVESLVWSSSDLKRSVLLQIITYLVGRHFGNKAAESIQVSGESFDRLLLDHGPASLDSLRLYQPALAAFETLEKHIRDLEGLPLQIRQVSAADPQLRYTSFDTPVIGTSRGRVSRANVYVQFEGSARWPDDLAAVQRTKIAFLMKIGELLKDSVPQLMARVGLEDPVNILSNASFLDILYPTGTSFRLRIHHERELSLLERALKLSSQSAGSRENAASDLSVYKRNFIQSPLHTQVVRTLSTRFPLLSPSIRLMKKWRDSHLLSDQISDELIEVLTIRIFVHPAPWSAPGSTMTGFLRTLLILSKWDWRSEPLIVDFTGEMSTQDVDAIRLRFEAWRKIDPAMNRIAMFAASNIDRDGITWTETGPSKVVAAYFTGLARAAISLVKEQGLNLRPEDLFVPNLADYDFLIHLDTRVTALGGGQEQKKGKFKNLQIQEAVDESLVGFDPVQLFLNELRSLYGGNVLFFRNSHSGSVIAGLWNPQTGPRSWKINAGYSTIPVEGEDAKININKEATLHDIGRLGGDMISTIESKR